MTTIDADLERRVAEAIDGASAGWSISQRWSDGKFVLVLARVPIAATLGNQKIRVPISVHETEREAEEAKAESMSLARARAAAQVFTIARRIPPVETP
jgi:uncharacterized protein (DUF1684 family)